MKNIAALSAPDKLSLGGALGAIRISSVTVSSPVEYVDIALPSGYGKFVLEFSAELSATDVLCVAVSMDGGDTFVCDTENHEAYNLCAMGMFTNGPITGISGIGYDSLGYLFSVSGNSFRGILDINPGDATHSFESSGDAIIYLASPDFARELCITNFNTTAEIPIVLGRANSIRILPYGNGDCDPPTSGETITAGTFTLFAASYA